MEAHLTNSTLTTINTELSKAWYLLSLLLRLGCLTRSSEVASRCALFRAPPDFVEHLCSLPNSPLFLTPHSFVTPLLVAFGKFMLNLDVIRTRIEVGGLEQRGEFGKILRERISGGGRDREQFCILWMVRKL